MNQDPETGLNTTSKKTPRGERVGIEEYFFGPSSMSTSGDFNSNGSLASNHFKDSFVYGSTLNESSTNDFSLLPT